MTLVPPANWSCQPVFVGDWLIVTRSICNVLDDLTRADLVMRADRDPGTAIYEVADVWHHHFVCRACGAVLDVPCAVGSKPCLDADIPGAIIDEAGIIFRGLCPS